MRSSTLWGATALLALAGAGWAESPPSAWDWAFTVAPSASPATPYDGTTPLGLPGAPQHFTDAQIHDLHRTVDWWPAEHPAMPDPVGAGRNGGLACGFCHLATGDGRPENAALAGLPADYIERQVAAFADGSRHAALANAPTSLMAATAKATAPADVAVAADYFSKLRFTSHVRVVEAARIPPAIRYHFVYVLGPGSKEPLGQRIVEIPDAPEAFELRDPHVRYTAYVPVGAIAAGATLAGSGGPAGLPCASCHGEKLQGGIAPPLAGRSPTSLVRQLMAFKTGRRAEPEAAAMRAVAAPLDDGQMIAVAAYAASQRP